MNLRTLRIALLLYAAFDLFFGGVCGGFFPLSQLAAAQFTTVTGTVTDPNGLAYAGGTIAPVLVSSGSPTLNGFAYTPPAQPVGLSSAGTFTMRLADVTVLLPAASTWSFTVCSGAGTIQPAGGKGPICFTVTGVSISGASQDIGATLRAAAPALSNSSGLPAGDITVTGNQLFSPTNTFIIGGTDALHTPMKIYVGGVNNGQLLLAPIQDGSAGQAIGVLTAQNGYFLLKSEAPFGSTAFEPGFQLLGSNSGIHGQIFATFGGGFNSSATTDATSGFLVSNTSLGTQTDFLMINTQGIGLEQHLNQGTWNQLTGAATQANKTGGTCAMAAGTTCTFTLTSAFTATPICIATAQGTNITGGAVACSVSGTTVTITAAAANSNTWGALLIGNPN